MRAYIYIVLSSLFLLSACGPKNKYGVISLNNKKWKFTTEDNARFADPGFDDSRWDDVKIGRSWESQGYSNYDGYAWYRTTFILSEYNRDQDLYLVMKNIDDNDMTYINGVLIGETGSMPPDYRTGVNRKRVYRIPRDVLSHTGKNVIAVRVYDHYGDGGILGPAKITPINDTNERISLRGEWKFSLGDSLLWASPGFNDSAWVNIQVPKRWGEAGYGDYDGFAWYRREVNLPVSMQGKDLLFKLGKVDDYCEFYFNGERIGGDFVLSDGIDSTQYQRYYRRDRSFYIPKHLTRSEKNLIAVRVFDGENEGGIYEGEPEICFNPKKKR